MRFRYFVLLLCLVPLGCKSGPRIPEVKSSNQLVRIQTITYQEKSSQEGPPKTHTITDQANLKEFTSFLARHKKDWQPEDGPPPPSPIASFDAICQDGQFLPFALMDHLLLTRGFRMPLSDDQFRTVRRLCLKQ
ncbi:MAG: hypothetical protein MI923_18960 [Phycisphaerales bacterium]|nr:hypothetical protein [Phycisphaerales bacterium]